MNIFRSGWKTSEFWLALGSIVGVATDFAGAVPGGHAKTAVAVISGAYAIARAVAKLAGAKVEAAKERDIP